MSAFVVNDETMQRAVCAMLTEPLVSGDIADRLGRDMYALNHQAVAERYGSNDDDPGADADWHFKRLTPLVLPRHGEIANLPRACQALKSLCCLRYQCSEGDVPKTALYHRIEARINELAYAIASSLPEYKDAKWD